MIDLHTHTLLSDGDLIASELVRRAYVLGYKALAITDHVDDSNIDMVLPGIIKVSKIINKYWDIIVIPGVEITHVPIEIFSDIVKYSRDKGAKIVLAHGESPVEPVLQGTNNAAINAKVDILAHPGYIKDEDVKLAAQKGIYLEITSRNGHSQTNKYVFDKAIKFNAKMVVNTDLHSIENFLTIEKRKHILNGLTDIEDIKNEIIKNSEDIVNNIIKNGI